MSLFSPLLISAYYAQHLKEYDSDYIFPSRVTDHYELAYLINDDHCLLSVDDQLYDIQGHAVVFRRPGQKNQSYMPYESILLCFDAEGLDAEKVLSLLPCIYQSPQFLGLRHIFEDIYKESLSNRDYSHIYTSAKLSEIIYTILQNSDSYLLLHNTTISNQHLLTLLKYIEKSIHKPFTIETMSKELALSQRHIYHLFKEHMQTTPINYINECRLNLSKKYLLNSNLPIYQISNLCGYENATYYITLFRKTFGITPAKYRKQADEVS